jgi:hypothetical protein
MNPSTGARGREVFVTLVFAALFGGGVFLYLVLVTGGFLLAVTAAAAAIGAVSGLHYLWWGRRLSRSERARAGSEADRRFR